MPLGTRRFRLALPSGLLLAFLLASLVGVPLSAGAGAPAAPLGATFVLVRHAEKAGDGRDPALSPAGERRARVLAQSLRAAPLVAAYATPYRRTRMTVAPAAHQHGLAVTIYDAGQTRAFATRLRRDHRDGTVLVVGHSNTIPDIAAALCGCAVAPMREDEYDRRLTVRIDAGDRATLHEDRY